MLYCLGFGELCPFYIVCRFSMGVIQCVQCGLDLRYFSLSLRAAKEAKKAKQAAKKPAAPAAKVSSLWCFT